MSYQRDPDAYTRGVGAVQAVDKVRAKKRFANPRARQALGESIRRDRLRQRLLRPALGAINTAQFSNAVRVPNPSGYSGAPGTPPMQQVTGSGGGGVIIPTGVRAVTAVGLTQPVSVVKGAMTAAPPLPAPGRPWQPGDPACSPTQSGIYPNCVNNTFGTNGGNGTTSTTTTTTTTSDGTVIPTSSVGAASGGASGPSGVMTPLPSGVTVDTTPIDTTGLDTTGLTTLAPATDYMKYLPYAAVGVALFLYMRSKKKGA